MPYKRTIAYVCNQCHDEFFAPPRPIRRFCSVGCIRSSQSPEAVWKHVAIVDDATSCWGWTGWTNNSNYGQLRCGGKRPLAHRVVWELTYGPIPDGLFVCHRCDTPPCCRPDHLFLGTSPDNTADMVRKGRQARGTMKPHALFTESQIVDIRRRLAGGAMQREIAAEFGTARSTISHIATRRSWSHVL